MDSRIVRNRRGPYNFCHISGIDRLHYSHLNYGLAFTIEERQRLGIHGLLPPRVKNLDEQAEHCKIYLSFCKTDIDKYVYLMELMNSHEKLFFKLLKTYTYEILPLIYTPTVASACQMYSLLYNGFKGLFLTIYDRGHVYDVLKNWPEPDVKAIVVTDGERILGIGDQGIDGMAIPIGKLCLYTALGGIKPHLCLPITIDVGTNSKTKLDDPLYLGIPQKRTSGKEYDDLIEEFMTGVVKRFGPNCLIQFEDFGNQNAFRLLEKYKNSYCCFNDDIQGTSAVCLAGILSALRITKKKLVENVFVFFGAGEANLGIANLCMRAMKGEGIPDEDARRRIWMVDSKGLIVKNRPKGGLNSYKESFAQDHVPIESLEEIVREIKPSVLIGASAIPGAFSSDVLYEMSLNNERPIIFALSNPTIKAECTAEEAVRYTNGSCLFASGSPFPNVDYGGKKYLTRQANNAYIFPGVALGILCSGMRVVDDDTFLVAAESLSSLVDDNDLHKGCLLPPMEAMVDTVSAQIALTVMEHAYKNGTASLFPEPQNKLAHILSNRYNIEIGRIFPVEYNFPSFK